MAAETAERVAIRAAGAMVGLAVGMAVGMAAAEVAEVAEGEVACAGGGEAAEADCAPRAATGAVHGVMHEEAVAVVACGAPACAYTIARRHSGPSRVVGISSALAVGDFVGTRGRWLSFLILYSCRLG